LEKSATAEEELENAKTAHVDLTSLDFGRLDTTLLLGLTKRHSSPAPLKDVHVTPTRLWGPREISSQPKPLSSGIVQGPVNNTMDKYVDKQQHYYSGIL
jgi:hypothetical protein